MLAAGADTLLVSAVSDPLPSGDGSDVEVTVRDRFGNPATGYAGTVHFSSDDPNPGVDLPADYTFDPAEAGSHRFADSVMLLTAGVITFVLHPQAAALQAQAFASKGEEARKIAFEAFFQLHKPVRVLYIVNVGLGIALLTVRVRSWIPR